MGAGITTEVELFKNGTWVKSYDQIFECDFRDEKGNLNSVTASPFYNQDYGVFGFLANVRNYSCVPTLITPRGLPDDKEEQYQKERQQAGLAVLCVEHPYQHLLDDHSHTWILASELLSFDYEATFENRRNIDDLDDPLPLGRGKVTTYKAFFNRLFFSHLNTLSKLDDPEKVRIVMSFNS